MDAAEAMLLGALQGLTEWLPVSSSGHLVVVQEKMGLEVPVFFDLWLHVATLLVLLGHYRRIWGRLARAVVSWPREARTATWRGTATPDRALAVALVVGTVPIALVGLAFQDAIEASFSSLRVVGFSFLITTALLVSTAWPRVPRRGAVPGVRSAIMIGMFQALALLPGVSRSGATIAGGIHAGMGRRDAADFGFLLFAPALVGALVLLTPDAVREPSTLDVWDYVLGGLAAAVVGYASLRLLLALVRRVGLWPFAPYTFALGVWLLV